MDLYTEKNQESFLNSTLESGYVVQQNLGNEMSQFRSLSGEAAFTRLENLELLMDGQVISPEEIFKEMYKELDPLLSFNRENRDRSDNQLHRERKVLVGRWKKDVREKRFSSNFDYHFEEGKITLAGKASPRTNMEKGRERLPSIVELMDKFGHVFLLRKCEHYDPARITHVFRSFTLPQAERENNPYRGVIDLTRSIVDLSWNRAFFRGEKLGENPHLTGKRNLGNYIELPRHIRSSQEEKGPRAKYGPNPLGPPQKEHAINGKPYILTPEPHLLAVLESLYEDGVPRITPRFKVIEINGKNIYLVRPSLNVIPDMSFDDNLMTALGKYAAVGHTLGLSGAYDRQMIHYAWEASPEGNPNLVQFDVDFWVYDRRKAKSRLSDQHLEITAFKQSFLDEYLFVCASDLKVFDESYKHHKEELTRELGPDIHTEVYRRLQPNIRDYQTIKDRCF